MGKTVVDRAALQGMTKKERQKFIRDLRRAERERRAKLKRRRKIIGWTVTGAAGVGVVALLTVTAVNTAATEAAAAASASAAAAPVYASPANMISDGLLLQASDDGGSLVPVTTAALEEGADPIAHASTAATTGVLDLQLYVDVTTDAAASWWATDADLLLSAASAGGATIELHPYAAGDVSGDALAAVAAFGCVAENVPDQALDVWQAMLGRATDGDPVTAATARSVVAEAGVTDEATLTCIENADWHQWAIDVSGRAAAGIPATADAVDLSAGLGVVAAGSAYTGPVDDADAFADFLDEAYLTAVGG